jgi:hypothetical protein
MAILPLPAELVVEPALPGSEEMARYAVGRAMWAGDVGSAGPQHPALVVQRRRQEIGYE